jgi:hypothetical protein
MAELTLKGPIDTRKDELKEMDAWFKSEMEKEGYKANHGGLLAITAGSDLEYDANHARYPSEKEYADLIDKIRAEDASRRKMELDLINPRSDKLLDVGVKKHSLGRRERTSRLASYTEFLVGEDTSAAEPRRPHASDKMPDNPRVRPCACGCGALVLDGADETELRSFCARPLNPDGIVAAHPTVDLARQRAACERLHQRRFKEKRDAEQESKSRNAGPKRPLDLNRILAMAKPKEEKTLDVEAELRRVEAAQGQHLTVSRSQPMLGPKWPPREQRPTAKPSAPAQGISSPSSAPSLVAAGFDSLAGTGMRFAAYIPKRQVQALGGGLRVNQLRRDHSISDDMPGLSELLGHVDIPGSETATVMPPELFGGGEQGKKIP